MAGPIPRNSPCLPTAALAEFSREMLLALRAGLPVSEVLAALGGEARSRRLRGALGTVRGALARGGSLADALAASGGAFPEPWVSQIRVAERGGFLADMFRHLWLECRRDERLRAAVRATAAYPLGIFWATVGVVAVMLLFLMPGVIRVIATNTVPVPPLTRALFRGVRLIHDYRVLLAFAAAWCLWWQAHLLLGGGLRWPGWRTLGRVYPFSGYLRQAEAATFLSTVGVLQGRGLPDAEVLDLACEALRGPGVQQDVATARQAAREGWRLGDTIGHLGFLPVETRLYLASIAPGPALAEALADQARLCEERIDEAVRSIRPMLEPVMMVPAGLVISLVPTALYLPLFNIGRKIK